MESVDDADLSPGAVSAESWVASLAYLKARAVADTLDADDHAIVLGADTVCVMGDLIIGQAGSPEEARAIIRSFENTEHGVITGVALVGRDGLLRDLFIDRATVLVGSIGEDRIEAYVRSGAWRGKAGAYNLTERVGAGWPIRFTGDESTIVGLPMRSLRARLSALGVVN